jgi:hypothetical protein
MSRMALLKFYNLLQSKTANLDETFYVTVAEKTRTDPRLAELVIERLSQDWYKLNPMRIRELNLKSRQPQTLAVLLEHVQLLENLAPRTNHPPFNYFFKLITHGLGPVPYQSYTVGLYKIGGRQQFKKAQIPHPLFAKWGYYENELFLKKQTKEKTTLDANTRKQILKNLIKEKVEFKVSDYIRACRGAIHRRQAERDLKVFFKLKTRGRTRAKVYKLGNPPTTRTSSAKSSGFFK